MALSKIQLFIPPALRLFLIIIISPCNFSVTAVREVENHQGNKTNFQRHFCLSSSDGAIIEREVISLLLGRDKKIILR